MIVQKQLILCMNLSFKLWQIELINFDIANSKKIKTIRIHLATKIVAPHSMSDVSCHLDKSVQKKDIKLKIHNFILAM